MEGLETTPLPIPPRPRTISVLVFLAVVAVIFSYLIAYAAANALVSAEVIAPWAKGSDPRPKWFGASFLIVMSGFMMLGTFARIVSRRQLRTIDEMENAPEVQHRD